MTPRIVDKNIKKNEILMSAIKVFSKKGIVGTKMIDIAQAANIGKGTIYEYFRSKEEIFACAFNTMFEDIEFRTRQGLAQTDDPIEQLKLLVDITLDYYNQDSLEYAAVMMDFWAEGVRTKNEKLLHIIDLQKIYTQYRQIIAAIIHKGISRGVFKKVDSKAFAAITLALLDGVFLQILMQPEIINIKNIKKTIAETLFAGLIISN